MEQKQSKQRNMKTLATKSEASTDKMVLKAESIVEVSKTKGVKAPAQVPAQTVAAPAPAPAQTSKAKKTETPVQVQQVQQAPAKLTKATKSVQPVTTQPAQSVATQPTQSVATQPTQPAQTAGQAKGKRVAQTLAPTAPTATVKAAATKAAATKATATKKVVAEATPTLVQKAGAKTAKTAKKVVSEKVVKAAKKVQKVNVEEAKEANEAQEEKQLDDKLRYFKLYYNDNICGRYSGKKPKQAANKAFSSIIKDMKKTDNKEGVNIDITFTIKECTRNSFHKEYKYVGKRLLLKSPVKVTIENGDGTSKDIVYKYHNDLKKAPKN
jgi:hypothetical protein